MSDTVSGPPANDRAIAELIATQRNRMTVPFTKRWSEMSDAERESAVTDALAWLRAARAVGVVR